MTEQNGFWPDGARLAFAPGHLGELTQYLPFELPRTRIRSVTLRRFGRIMRRCGAARGTRARLVRGAMVFEGEWS